MAVLRGLLLSAGAVGWAAAAACAETALEPPACYDAQVLATVVNQIPSDVSFGPDEIVVSWPWFVDLDVQAELRGMIPDERITVLTVQHTYMRTDRPITLWLRRHSGGGFNVVGFGDGQRPRRCTPADGRARPYIAPAPGGTYGQLRAEGERRYGQHR